MESSWCCEVQCGAPDAPSAQAIPSELLEGGGTKDGGSKQVPVLATTEQPVHARTLMCAR